MDLFARVPCKFRRFHSTFKGEFEEIAVKSEHDVEWKIGNIFSFTGQNYFYTSPSFKLADRKWNFIIQLNGKESLDGWISLYLVSKDCNLGATYNFGIKDCDRRIIRTPNLSWIFSRNSNFGYAKFLKTSKLVERKTEFAPLDTLTITCTLRKHENICSTASGESSILSTRLLEMFTSQKACDVTLQVKHEKFSVHKVILMAHSPVFAALFESPMKEKTTGVVDIEDCDPQAFKDFLVYLYSGKLENVTNHMFELFMIADKYDVQDLKSECLIALMGNLSVENFIDFVNLANKFGKRELKIKANEFLTENYAVILRTSEWLNFMKKYPNQANDLLIQMADNLKYSRNENSNFGRFPLTSQIVSRFQLQ